MRTKRKAITECKKRYGERFVTEEGVLYLRTQKIYLTYKKKKYDLGEFTIRIAGDDFIKILTDDKRIWSHPHVHHNLPCFGNIDSLLTLCLKNYYYVEAFECITEYLSKYNGRHADMYSFLRYLEEHKNDNSN